MIQTNIRAQLAMIPILVAIMAFVFVSAQIFIWNPETGSSNVYSAAIALGAILSGFLSDAFSRRTMLISVHILGILFLTLYYFYSSALCLFLFGVAYNPLAIVRAGLIDNVTSYSKIKLISLSFIFQFFPRTLYFLYVKIPQNESFFLALGALSFSLIIAFILFFDRRDFRIHKVMMFSKVAFFLPHVKPKAVLTFIAFVPTQIAYFVADNLLETYSLNPVYYSLLAFGSLVGAAMSTFYKKTPHIAVLTIAYGLCLVVTILPVAAFFFYSYEKLDIPFTFVVLGSLLGFLLPFVYDIILHSIEKHYRGTGCGMLDFVFSGSSLVTLALFKILSHHTERSLILVVVAFILAFGIQRASEKTPL